MEIADHIGLPFVVHSRDASKKTVDFLKERKSLIKHGFLMHCYSESAETAKIYQDLGGYFSFGGVITFKNAKKLPDVVKIIPDELLLVETDCPYLAPEPYRGKLCHSGLIKYTAEKIAEIRGTITEQVLNLTANNARKLFNL